MTLIDQRPAEVLERLVPGHWEGDLIKGKQNRSQVGTLVERSTFFVALVRLENGNAETAAEGFAQILNRFDAEMRRSMTYDRGREMARHQNLSERTGLKVYFAPPAQPLGTWHQREHQRPLAPIPTQRRRPQRLLARSTRRHSRKVQRKTKKVTRLESSSRTLPANRSLRLPETLVR